MDIGVWLSSMGLDEYAAVFERNGVDADLIPELTNDDLKDLGVDRLADRKALLKAIGNLDSEVQSLPRSVAPGPIPDGEYRQVTIMFADLAGYTEMTSQLGAEETHSVLNQYFDMTDSVVQAYGGAVDKHIGDNVMAVFGAPIAHDDDPLRATRTALDIHHRMAELSAATNLDLKAHIGIASGRVVASGTGSEAHHEYTVTGDAVNLAARLQDRAANGETFIGDSVHAAISDHAVCTGLGEMTLKGIDRPIGVWRVDALSEPVAGAARAEIVGRRAEIAQFSGIADLCAKSGHGQALVIRGEAGIGKTRLVEEFTEIAAQRGFSCHRALVLNFGVGENREAIPSIVRSLLELEPNDIESKHQAAIFKAVDSGLLAADQAMYLGDILELQLPLDVRATYDAMDNATRIEGKRNAVCDLLRQLSGVAPRVVVVEDVHWSTPTILSNLASLAEVTNDCPVLLIMTSRNEGFPLDEAWREASGSCTLSTIDLGPLRIEDAIKFADTFVDEADNFAKDCIQRAAGNPLFLEQLLHNAKEHGGGDVPASIQSLVMARLDRLPASDKLALQAASILGQQFSLSALRDLIADPGYDCQGLLGRRLVRPEGDGYLFAHALVQEGVYASLLTARRSQLHRKAAEWFASTHPELRAEHLDRADDPDAPCAYLDAGQVQAAIFHYETALRLVKRGLELASEPSTICDLMCLRGDALRNVSETDKSISSFKAALDSAQDESQRCTSLIGIAGGLRIADRQGEALVVLQEAEEAAIRGDLIPERAQIHYLRGNAYFPLGDIDGCLREHEKALQFARDAGSAESEALALGGLGDAYYLRGHMQTACDQFRACVDICKRHGFGRIEVANSHMIGWTRIHLMEFVKARDDALNAVEMAREVNHRRAECLGLMLAGRVEYELGIMAEAQDHLLQSLELARALSANNFEAQLLSQLARVSAEMGDPDKARALAEKAVAVVEKRTGMTFIGPTVYAVHAALVEESSERREAFIRAERILDAGSVWHNQIWFAEVAIDAALKDQKWEEAERYADRLELNTREQPLAWSEFLIARARAIAAWGRGDRKDTTRNAIRDLYERTQKHELARIALELERVHSEC